MQHSNTDSCILLKFYIKPQLRLERELAYCVVSYRNSTSNHNSKANDLLLSKLYLIDASDRIYKYSCCNGQTVWRHIKFLG